VQSTAAGKDNPTEGLHGRRRGGELEKLTQNQKEKKKSWGGKRGGTRTITVVMRLFKVEKS